MASKMNAGLSKKEKQQKDGVGEKKRMKREFVASESEGLTSKPSKFLKPEV
jgi:hypothetical protein